MYVVCVIRWNNIAGHCCSTRSDYVGRFCVSSVLQNIFQNRHETVLSNNPRFLHKLQNADRNISIGTTDNVAQAITCLNSWWEAAGSSSCSGMPAGALQTGRGIEPEAFRLGVQHLVTLLAFATTATVCLWESKRYTVCVCVYVCVFVCVCVCVRHHHHQHHQRLHHQQIGGYRTADGQWCCCHCVHVYTVVPVSTAEGRWNLATFSH